MGHKNFTTPSSASYEIRDAPLAGAGLDLPEGIAPRSLPPCIALMDFVRRNRELRQWFPRGVKSAQERWAAKIDVEFSL